jgi:NADPH2:quinone reductase
VIASAAGPERARFCRELGAEHVIDRRAGPIERSVRELTQGRGADVVFDPVGGEAYAQAARCVAHEGRILAVGFASGRWGRPDLAHLVTHNYSVLGVLPAGYDRSLRLAAQQELVAHHARGEIRVPVERELAFEALPEGLEQLARGEVRGKLVLRGP